MRAPLGAATVVHLADSHLPSTADFLPIKVQHKAVTYLPSWHAYGRTLDYYCWSRGAQVYYSDVRHLKKDMGDVQV